MPDILARVAPALGAEVILEPEFKVVGLIRFPNGRQSYFWHNKLNLNSVSAARIAQDKGYTCFFLDRLGFAVPRTRTFFAPRLRRRLGSDRDLGAAYAYARELGLPVYVKPCRRSQGEGVTLVDSRASLEAAARRIFERDQVLLVQEACAGRDYRVVVLDGEVISAYERVPLAVTGDGSSSVAELLAAKQRTFELEGRDTRIDFEDPRLAAGLRRQRLSKASVLPAGRQATLLEVANLSCGGTTIEITDRLHPTVASLSARIAAALDLRFAGIDVMTADATQPLGAYAVLEVNSAPGLDHYGGSGPEHVARIDRLYSKVLEAIARGPA
jgi:D-alanine-D-alanine ligase-like ATP-grasp enzyme